MHVTVQSWWMLLYWVARCCCLTTACCASAGLIALALAEDRPNYPGIFVRQGNRGDVRVASTLQQLEPLTAPIRLVLAGFDR